MNHTDHVNLIRDGIPQSGGIWADLGAGTGAFTLALAELIGPSGIIYAVDKNQEALHQLIHIFGGRFPNMAVHAIKGDIRKPLDLPPLDGLVMANALHFVRRQTEVLQHARDYLRPDGRLIIVEYNIDRGNRWVPHPFSYPTWESMAKQAGFAETRLLAVRSSRTFREIYAAVAFG